jgi:hypothetical protein
MTDQPAPGTPGASAQREALRRRERRELATAQGSRLARSVHAVAGPSAAERRQIAAEQHWLAGAHGERMVADAIAKRCPQALVLHDRRLPGSRANIDHLVVSTAGVHVIDTKRYHGKIEIARPLFGQAKLKIAGRDRTSLIVALQKQVQVVSGLLRSELADGQVHGALCFVCPEGLFADSGLPVFRTLKLKGLPLLTPRGLTKRLNAPGSLSPTSVARIHELLAATLRPA